MSKNIETLLQTGAWQEIEEMFTDTIDKLKNDKIKEEIGDKEYKTIHLSNIKAALHIEKLLKKIKTSSVMGDIVNKVKYV